MNPLFDKERQENDAAGAAKNGWVKDQKPDLRCGVICVIRFIPVIQGRKTKMIITATFCAQNDQEVELSVKMMIRSQLRIPRFTMPIQTPKKQRRLVAKKT